MSKIYTSADQLIGKTPLLELAHIEKELGLKAKLVAKLEYFNPAGSVKDRIGKAMIDDAEKSGKLKPGSVIIEPTSGNTGIGLGFAAAAKGYKLILTMPETMSVERRNILRAYGAKLVLTEGAKGMKGAIEKATELAAASDNTFIPQQFENEANVKAHYETTGPEIWNDTDGKVDIFVASVGSGGTVSGTGKYLKEKNSSIRVYGVEAAASPVLNGGNAGPHKIQGISAGFIPKIYDKSVVDEVIDITDEEAFDNGRTLAQSEGLFIGISSGAAISAAIKLAQKDENKDKIIVDILPDSGDRYLSTALYHQD